MIDRVIQWLKRLMRVRSPSAHMIHGIGPTTVLDYMTSAIEDMRSDGTINNDTEDDVQKGDGEGSIRGD